MTNILKDAQKFAGLNLELLLNNVDIGVVVHNWDTKIRYANPAALRLLRLSFEQIIGKDAWDPQWTIIDEGHRRLDVEEYPVSRVIKTGQPIKNEILGLVDGSTEEVTWLLVSAYYEKTDGEEAFIIATFNDITETRHIFSFQKIVEHTDNIVLITESKNIEGPNGPSIIYVNPAFEQSTGYSSEEVIGKTPRILQGPDTDKRALARIKQALKQQKPIEETILNYQKDGTPYWLELKIFPLLDNDQKVTHFAAIQRDVTENKVMFEQLKAANEKLEQLAFIDPLTEISNRRMFEESAVGLVQSAQRRGEMIGVGIIDIDNFKSINDNYGHGVGDKVIRAFAQCLTQSFRRGDIYCRYGGEEFAFMASASSEKSLRQMHDRLLNNIRSLSVKTEKTVLNNITASIGIRIVKAQPDTDSDEALKLADKALYEAKHSGKDQVCYFEPD